MFAVVITTNDRLPLVDIFDVFDAAPKLHLDLCVKVYSRTHWISRISSKCYRRTIRGGSSLPFPTLGVNDFLTRILRLTELQAQR